MTCTTCEDDGLVNLPEDEGKIVAGYLAQGLRHDPRTGDELITMLPCQDCRRSDIADGNRLCSCGLPATRTAVDPIDLGQVWTCKDCGEDCDQEIERELESDGYYGE